MRRQAIVHSYGDQEEWDAEESLEHLKQCMNNGTVPHSMPSSSSQPSGVHVSIGGKKPCKCGSTSHQRTSHSKCPLNKKRCQVDSQNTS